MRTDHAYLRSLLQLRSEPHVPILWLAVPWGVGAAWSVGVVRAYLFEGVPPGLASRIDIAFMLGGFLLGGGVGLLITWGLLYIAWPRHLRVLCWSAALGLLGIWCLPSPEVAIVPLFVTLCVVGAIAEQAFAARRGSERKAVPRPSAER